MKTFSELLERYGGRFAAELGIDVKAGPRERQKWFLAAILFGARISGRLAARTYRVFMARKILTPEAILAQGWDGLVALLDEGGYARYDFKTATKLLKVMESLQRDYQGSLEGLHQASRDPGDLEARLQALAPGIGPGTVNIFLRELREVWFKAIPPLSSLAQAAAEQEGFLPTGLDPQEALERLAELWQVQPVAGYDLADLEAALVRLGLELRREGRKTVRGREPGNIDLR
jgi:endonuclease III